METREQKDSRRRQPHRSRCHRCRRVVDERIHARHLGRDGCGWVLCPCGGCGCNYRGRERRPAP
jgi:hypothetical protein